MNSQTQTTLSTSQSQIPIPITQQTQTQQTQTENNSETQIPIPQAQPPTNANVNVTYTNLFQYYDNLPCLLILQKWISRLHYYLSYFPRPTQLATLRKIKDELSLKVNSSILNLQSQPNIHRVAKRLTMSNESDDSK